jgi:hypothetical protein
MEVCAPHDGRPGSFCKIRDASSGSEYVQVKGIFSMNHNVQPEDCALLVQRHVLKEVDPSTLHSLFRPVESLLISPIAIQALCDTVEIKGLVGLVRVQ